MSPYYIQDSTSSQLYLLSLFIGMLTAPSPALCSMPWRVMSDCELKIMEVRMECYPNIVSINPVSKATIWLRMVLLRVLFDISFTVLRDFLVKKIEVQDGTLLPFCWATCMESQPATEANECTWLHWFQSGWAGQAWSTVPWALVQLGELANHWWLGPIAKNW